MPKSQGARRGPRTTGRERPRTTGRERPEVPGYDVGPPVGFGSRGPLWSATGRAGCRAGAGRPCVVAVLPAAPDRLAGDEHRRRLAALVGSPHPHVADVLEVVRLPGEACAVVSERLAGPNLAVLRVSRPALAAQEIAWLIPPLARGLAHLHGSGVVHGDVSPANVVLADGSRPVLVDLVGGSAPDLGTPGFTAPERDGGQEPSPSGDVWSLATTAVWMAGARDRVAVRAALAPALEPRPEDRCSAEDLAALVAGLGTARAVEVPSPAALAQANLRARSAIEETRLPVEGRLGRERKRGAAAGGRHGRRRAAPRRLGAARWTSAVRAVSVGAGVVGAAVVGVVVASLVVTGLPGEDPAGPPHAAASGATGSAAAHPDPREALHQDARAVVRTLVGARDRALDQGDAEALTALTVPGSAAAEADASLVAALEAGGRAAGLRTSVLGIDVLDVSAGEQVVRLTTRQGAYERSAPDAPSGERVAAGPVRCAVLVLVGDDGDGWRVRDVGPCEEASGSG